MAQKQKYKAADRSDSVTRIFSNLGDSLQSSLIVKHLIKKFPSAISEYSSQLGCNATNHLQQSGMCQLCIVLFWRRGRTDKTTPVCLKNTHEKKNTKSCTKLKKKLKFISFIDQSILGSSRCGFS